MLFSVIWTLRTKIELIYFIQENAFENFVMVMAFRAADYFEVLQWIISWWRYQMKTFPALLALCEAIHRSVTRTFDVFCYFFLNERLNKQSRCRWFEARPWSLWRHCNVKPRNHPTTKWNFPFQSVKRIRVRIHQMSLGCSERKAGFIIWQHRFDKCRKLQRIKHVQGCCLMFIEMIRRGRGKQNDRIVKSLSAFVEIQIGNFTKDLE